MTGAAALKGKGNSLKHILLGNDGNNILTGGAGDDVYFLGRSSAKDTVVDSDTTAGNHDYLQFGSDVSYDQLWFKHVGNDLEIDIIGTANSLTIKNWYTGTQNHIETLTSGNGKVLTDSHVQNLVNAMATMSQPVAGQTYLTADQQNTLAPVFAANWT